MDIPQGTFSFSRTPSQKPSLLTSLLPEWDLSPPSRLSLTTRSIPLPLIDARDMNASHTRNPPYPVGLHSSGRPVYAWLDHASSTTSTHVSLLHGTTSVIRRPKIRLLVYPSTTSSSDSDSDDEPAARLQEETDWSAILWRPGFVESFEARMGGAKLCLPRRKDVKSRWVAVAGILLYLELKAVWAEAAEGVLGQRMGGGKVAEGREGDETEGIIDGLHQA